MHRSHLIFCLAMLGVAVLVALVWGVQLGTLALLVVVLLCPLAMIVMIWTMVGRGGAGRPGRSDREITR